MSVPLWLAIAVVAVLGIKLTNVPTWLVVVLLIAGFLIANSPLGPALDTLN
ncbi:hypothetical protein [Streptomyces bathyalis]|uniref:hypothetical protein n=1 Tax=Streptomyces bathyalis TaxID=2710756 RepID=UPI0018D1E345|nr:hypothetical protein [Streptomyces bathyalis]